jgi:hypothetical protein
LSRHQRDFKAVRKAPPGTVPRDEREAIACFLSAGEGWSEALNALGGAFATEAAATLQMTPARGAKRSDDDEINHRTSEYLQWPGLKKTATDND